MTSFDIPAGPRSHRGGPQAAAAPGGDRAVKRRRVLDILDAAGRDSLLLTGPAAVAWYLDGSRVHVGLAGDPVAAVLVARDGDHVASHSNEAARLGAEELPEGVVLHQIPWFGTLAEIRRWFGSGSEPALEVDFARQLREARRSLLPGELRRYEALCRDAAAALTEVLGQATPATTERQVAAALAERTVAAGADAMVILCGGASRAAFRHPLPTAGPLGRRAMAVLCARRDGMIANVTRWVRFGEPSPGERDAEARIAAVEADIFAATLPGARLNEVLGIIRGSYQRHGFDADEWLRHHQGGPAGYAGRDPRATPDTDDEVVAGQAFAWNPSAPGVKIEDTVLVAAGGIRPLSVDERWPVSTESGLARPAVLQL